MTIDADCEHCGTQFPRLSVDWTQKDPRWCDFVECDELEKLTVKAIPGSAVFWKNLHETGWGNPKTLHAGLPVENGSKVGVNIWTRGPGPGACWLSVSRERFISRAYILSCILVPTCKAIKRPQTASFTTPSPYDHRGLSPANVIRCMLLRNP